MTNTLPQPRAPQAPRARKCRRPATHKRSATASGSHSSRRSSAKSSWTDRLRDPLNSGLQGRRQDRVLGHRRVYPSVQARVRRQERPTRLKASGSDYFDLTPDDDQKMIVETVSEFAEEILRPAAHDADAPPPTRPN